jgi:hypothetical protein
MAETVLGDEPSKKRSALSRLADRELAMTKTDDEVSVSESHADLA